MLCAAIVGDSETLQLYSESVLEHLLNGRKEWLHIQCTCTSVQESEMEVVEEVPNPVPVYL